MFPGGRRQRRGTEQGGRKGETGSSGPQEAGRGNAEAVVTWER